MNKFHLTYSKDLNINYFKVNLLLLLISTDMEITISVSFYIRELDSGFSLIAFHVVFDFALCGLFFLICFFLKTQRDTFKKSILLSEFVFFS